MGILSADEFTSLLQAFDPRVKSDGVLKTIQKIAPGQEGLDVPGFNKWVTMVFGKASDEDFESGMRMLLSTAEATSPRKKRAAAGSAVDEEWEVICCRSSGGSGTPLVYSTPWQNCCQQQILGQYCRAEFVCSAEPHEYNQIFSISIVSSMQRTALNTNDHLCVQLPVDLITSEYIRI